MTNKDNATARPWEARLEINGRFWILNTDPINKIVAQIEARENHEEARANARLVVKAVNMHDDLVSAVNDAFCLIGEALIDNSPTEEERETWSSLQDKLRELLLRNEKE